MNTKRMNRIKVTIPDEILVILNQLFQIETKAQKLNEPNSIPRNIQRAKEEFEKLGFLIENPLGQKYDETRTDCEASIAGESTENLVITEVLRPLIRFSKDGFTQIAQRAVVIVQDSLSIS